LPQHVVEALALKEGDQVELGRPPGLSALVVTRDFSREEALEGVAFDRAKRTTGDIRAA
jgi:antitoxin component of MazEF toxin-antitoxin module